MESSSDKFHGPVLPPVPGPTPWCHRPYRRRRLRRRTRTESIYAVVYGVNTRSLDPGRPVIARGEDEDTEEGIYSSNPQLGRLLCTRFDALIVGRNNADTISHRLPSLPPRIHAFVYACDPEEVGLFTSSLDFLHLLVSSNTTGQAVYRRGNRVLSTPGQRSQGRPTRFSRRCWEGTGFAADRGPAPLERYSEEARAVMDGREAEATQGKLLGMVVGGSLSHGVTVRPGPVSFRRRDKGRDLRHSRGLKVTLFRRCHGCRPGIGRSQSESHPSRRTGSVHCPGGFRPRLPTAPSRYCPPWTMPAVLGDSQGPLPAKTVPSHFSRTCAASERDVEMVFGSEDKGHFWIGIPSIWKPKFALT